MIQSKCRLTSTKKTRSTAPKSRRRKGAAAVEFALVAPLMFLVILGIFEFGRAFMVAQLITNAAREGARNAVVEGSTNAEVEAKVEEYLLTGGINAADITITITVEGTVSDVSNAQSGDACAVKVEVPFSSVQYLVGQFLQNQTLDSIITMRHE